MKDWIFTLLEIVVTVAVAIATRFLIPLLRSTIAESKNELWKTIAATAVRAAEQIIRERGAGERKFELAKQIITDFGIKLTDEQIRILIEAAVQVMNNDGPIAAVMVPAQVLKEEDTGPETIEKEEPAYDE